MLTKHLLSTLKCSCYIVGRKLTGIEWIYYWRHCVVYKYEWTLVPASKSSNQLWEEGKIFCNRLPHMAECDRCDRGRACHEVTTDRKFCFDQRDQRAVGFCYPNWLPGYMFSWCSLRVTLTDRREDSCREIGRGQGSEVGSQKNFPDLSQKRIWLWPLGCVRNGGRADKKQNTRI